MKSPGTAAITTFNEQLGRYEILGVMGPDEYHDAYPDAETPGLNNNACTNVLTVYVLRTAPSSRPQAQDDLMETLGLEQEELSRWQDIIRRMRRVPRGRDHQPVRRLRPA